jgi:hypothetical protein
MRTGLYVAGGFAVRMRNRLGLNTTVAGGVAGVVFDRQPIIGLRGDPVTKFTFVTIVYENNPGCGELRGKKTAPFIGGFARFTDLQVDKAGTGVVFRFCAGDCAIGVREVADVLSEPLSIRPGRLLVVTHPAGVTTGRPFIVQPRVKVQYRIEQGFWVTWKGYDHSITVAHNDRKVRVLGRRTMWFSDGIAHFTDLRVDQTGYTSSNFRLLFTSCFGAPEQNCMGEDFEDVSDDYMSTVSDQFISGASTPKGIVVSQQPRDGLVGELVGGVCLIRVGTECTKVQMAYPPRVELVDELGNRVGAGSWFVCAELALGNELQTRGAGSTFRGDTFVRMDEGVAEFTTLRVFQSNTGYTLNFTVHNGALYSTCDSPVFARASSAPFFISFNTANGLKISVPPGAQLGAGELLTPMPVVAFQDSTGNVVTVANCTGTTRQDLEACTIRIYITILSMSGGVNRKLTEQDAFLYNKCGPPNNEIGDCSVVPVDKPANVHTSSGYGRFTDLVLRRAGSYRLSFFSQLLNVQSSVFYVSASFPNDLELYQSPRTSSCKQFNATSDWRCRYGGMLMPAPRVRLWDRFDNFCLDGSYSTRIEILNNPGGGTLACSDRVTTGACTVKSAGGWAVFDGLTIDAMGTGYTLRLSISASEGRDAKGNPFEIFRLTAPFDLYAARYAEFIDGLSTTPVGCPVYPFPALQLWGFTAASPDRAIRLTDIDEGSVSVTRQDCTVVESTGDLSLESTTMRVIRGTYKQGMYLCMCVLCMFVCVHV